MFVVHVGRDEELLESITRHAKERGVTDAALTLIGAVRECTVSVMGEGQRAGRVRPDRRGAAGGAVRRGGSGRPAAGRATVLDGGGGSVPRGHPK